MHSRIFIIKSMENIMKRGFGTYRKQEQITFMLPRVNYATLCDKEDFKDSIKWLGGIYGIDIIYKEIVDADRLKKIVAVLSPEEQQKMLAQAKKDKIDNIKNAKKLLSQPINKINPRFVAETIYPMYSFWFEIDGELTLDLDLPSNDNFNSSEELYITEIYDYHF